MLAVVFAAALGMTAFIPALKNGFVWDDFPFIADNPAVTQPGPWYRFWRLPYWPAKYSRDKLYRPLTAASFRLNYVLAGLEQPEPFPFHAVNLVLHALTSGGVALLAWRLSRRTGVAWLAGALFAAHPLHAEAVATGYGRSELLAAFFSVWLLARYVRWWDEPGSGPRTPPAGAAAPVQHSGDDFSRRSFLFHGFNALLLLAAVMSKEHAVFVWPAIIVFDVWRRWRKPAQVRPGFRDWLNRVAGPAHLGFVFAISVFFLLRYWLFTWKFRLGPESVSFWQSPVAHATLVEHLLTPFRLLWLTAKLTVWPAALCPIWSIPALSLPKRLEPDVVAGMALLAGLVILAILTWRRSALGPVVIGLLLLLAIPVQALPMAHWIYAERWLYLPSVLIAVLVAAGLDRLGSVGRVVGVSAALVLLPASWQYGTKFRDFPTMMTEVVRRQPDNYNGWRQLMNMHYRDGDYESAIQAAREMNERFAHVAPEPPSDPYFVLFKSYLAQGDGRRALEALDMWESLRREPEFSMEEDRRQAEALIAQEQAMPPATTSSRAGP